MYYCVLITMNHVMFQDDKNESVNASAACTAAELILATVWQHQV